MKRNHTSIPEPTSSFLRVACGECGEIQVVYSHSSTSVTCNSCGNELASPTGSVARLNGKVLDGTE